MSQILRILVSGWRFALRLIVLFYIVLYLVVDYFGGGWYGAFIVGVSCYWCDWLF